LILRRVRAGLRVFREKVGYPTALVVAGGVAANDAIRRGLLRFASGAGLKLITPPPALCTDNGAMIAWTGIERQLLGLTDGFDFAPRPRWPLDQNPDRAHHGKA
jgi:N6-L-threonylcarbamoyladenine synthase